MDKKVLVQLNGSRKIKGIMRGYDVFLNIVIDEAVEERSNGEVVKVGIAVCTMLLVAVSCLIF